VYETERPDRLFKTVLLVLVMLSVVVQILVSAWFYDKLRMLDEHLSLYPVNKPVEVGLKVTIPELVEIDRKIDALNRRLDGAEKVRPVPRESVETPEKRTPPEPAEQVPEAPQSKHVDVIEKIKK
jgi:hypothetical protein